MDSPRQKFNWTTPGRNADDHEKQRPSTTDINSIPYISQSAWDGYQAAMASNEKGSLAYKNAAAMISKFDELRVMYEEADGLYPSEIMDPGCTNCKGKAECRVFIPITRANHTSKCGFCRRNNKPCNVWEMASEPPPTIEEYRALSDAQNMLDDQVKELQDVYMNQTSRIAGLERNITDLRKGTGQPEFKDPEAGRRSNGGSNKRRRQ